VVLWGFTAILGKLITLRAVPLVWWRMTIVFATLSLVPVVWSRIRRLASGLRYVYLGIGVLIALHWVTFYSAIKLANASVAATCIALTPVFTAVVEPFIVGRKFELRELLLGVLVIPGVALVVGGTPATMQLGIAIGVLSALLLTVFSCLNKLHIERADPLSITALEMFAGAAFLAAVAPWTSWGENLFALPSLHDGLLLAVLAIGCTLLPFALALIATRHLSAFSSAIAVNLEPLYAILLAAVLLGEQRELSLRFYAGAAIIVLTVLTSPFILRTRTSPSS
jgi:drug/metabolite transporter (DMT)-like permease